jgi:colanic acid/amylovoran biosynthesis glycosyltransferase
MNLVVVSSRWPFGNKEPYLRTELSALARHFDRITVVPARTPRGGRQPSTGGIEVLAWPLLSPEIVVRALRIVAARPSSVGRVIAELATSKDRGRVKNAAMLLKGLALAQWVTENNVGHIHGYWLSAPATVAMIAAEVAGIPWSATAHRWDIYECNAIDAKARSVTFVRTISTRGARDLGTMHPALRERIVRLPLGAAVPAEPSWQAQSNREFTIVCPAWLGPVKGHEELLDAIALLRDRGVPVKCLLAGEGPLHAAITKWIALRSLDERVELCGFVPQERLLDWYREGRVNAVVLASRDDEHGMEGIPSALVEAMAYGVPVVATSSGSIGELVDDSCGHIVSPRDPRALADALFDVYERPFEALARAATAFARVASTHDVDRQMHALSERIHS